MEAVIKLQSVVRSMLAQRRFQAAKKAAVVIQAAWKAHQQRNR
jgi:hypothetical protein